MDEYSFEELQHLLKRAQQGSTTADLGIPMEEEGLSDDELAAIATSLHQTNDTPRQSMLMKILGYGGVQEPRRYAGALEPFLHGPDSWPASRALEVLCDFWGLTGEYVETLKEFIRGEPWDDRATCQREALEYAAEYLASHARPDLLAEIVDLYENVSSTPSGPENPFALVVKDSAYKALWRLLGYPDGPESTIIVLAKKRLDDEKGAIGR